MAPSPSTSSYLFGHMRTWFGAAMNDDLGAMLGVVDRSNERWLPCRERELDRLRPALEPVAAATPDGARGRQRADRVRLLPDQRASPRSSPLDEGGESVDTAMIGREGMTGLAVFLGTGQSPVRTIVQVPLTGRAAAADALRAELARGGTLVTLLQRHTQVVMVTMAQLILCNRIHRLDQRAARWLLQVDERVDEAPFDVTQEFLAQMIGVQRPALSVAMRQFKDAGLVRYSRGQVSIADRDGLLARSCGCIKIIAAEAARLRETLKRETGAN